MKPTFKEFLQEAPLHDYQTIGNFDKGSSFRDARDRRIIQHPKAIERTRKKFGNTPYDFDFYFVNSAKAMKHSEVGMVKPEWVKDNLGDEVYAAIEPNLDQDHIQVIFTNNTGAERVPLTAWMMAHRIGHALNSERNGSNNAQYQYDQVEKHLIQQFRNMASAYGIENAERLNSRGEDNRKKQLSMLYFFYEVSTFKSARERNIRDWFEILNELIAQYLTTGKIKFKPAPRCFGGGSFANKQRYCIKNDEELSDVNDELEMLGRDLGFMLDDMLGAAVNSVFVM